MSRHHFTLQSSEDKHGLEKNQQEDVILCAMVSIVLMVKILPALPWGCQESSENKPISKLLSTI